MARIPGNGEQLPVRTAPAEILRIDFRQLLENLQRVYDILDTLDRNLIEQCGQNKEWQDYLNDFS